MIGFVGLSHLGIVSSIATAAKGEAVLAYDTDPALIAQLLRSELPVVEKDLPELLTKAKEQISFSADAQRLRSCEILYLSRDVPTDAHNQSDLSVLSQQIAEVTMLAQPGATIVILCQVPPGFVRQVNEEIQAKRAGEAIRVIYQVETLIFGDAVARALNPERYIVGLQDPAAALPALYQALLEKYSCPIVKMRYESAELAKIAINICLISSLTTANIVSELCEHIGAEWSDIEAALRLDKRIGKHAYLKPGLGISGGNLERDLVTLSRFLHEYGVDSGVIDSWFTNLKWRREWVLRNVYQHIFTKKNEPTIAVWGLAYKAGTHSIKNSPALELIKSLPGIKLQVYDPQVKIEPNAMLTQSDSALAACEGADALVIMTPWDEFAQCELNNLEKLLRLRLIIDPFGALVTSIAREPHQLHYITMGRGEL